MPRRGGAYGCRRQPCGLFGFAAVQVMTDAVLDNLQGDLVTPALGDDDVGVLFARLDECLVHGFHRREVLFNDRLQGAAPLVHVPLDAAEDADVRVGIDVQFDVHIGAQARIRIPSRSSTSAGAIVRVSSERSCSI